MTHSTAARHCTLPPDAFRARVDAWRQLARTALHRQTSPGRIVTAYPNAPVTAERLRQLVEAEGHCCSFLEFDIDEQASVIILELRYPPEHASVVAAVLG